MSQTQHSPRHEHVEKVGTYIMVFVALMVLLALTYGAGKVDLDRVAPGLNLTVAMIIAIVKALLVVLIFMHVKNNTRATWVFASASFIVLGVLIVLTLSDYDSRQLITGTSNQPPEANTRAATFEHNNTHDDINVPPTGF